MERKFIVGGIGIVLLLCSSRAHWFRGILLPIAGVGMIFTAWLMHISERMSGVSRDQNFYVPTPQEREALEKARQQQQQRASSPPAGNNPAAMTKAQLDAKLAALRAMEAEKKAASQNPPPQV
jgi:hypothetical protein